MLSATHLIGFGAGGLSVGRYLVDYSCRFAPAASPLKTPVLNRKMVVGTPKKQTIAFWFKIGTDLETTRRLFMAGDSTDEGGFWLWLDADDKLRVYLVTTGAAATRFDATSSMKFRDPAAWYHLCATWDTTLSSPFFKVFVNNAEITYSAGTLSLAQNDTIGLNAAIGDITIGRLEGSTNYFDGYLSQMVCLDGTVITDPAAGGLVEVDNNGVVRPVDLTGLTTGPEGWLLDFANSTFLGKDVSTSGDQVNSYASSQWSGATGSYSFGDGRIEADTVDKAIKSVATFAGDFELQWEYKATANWAIGVYETGEDGTFNDSSSSGGMASMTNSWYIKASSIAANNDIFYGDDEVVNATTIGNGDVWNISRSAGTFKIEKAGSTIHTWSQTSTNTVRMVFAQGDAAADVVAVNWVDNSTLGNNFFTSDPASPDRMPDSPTNNYCVISSVDLLSTMTLADGNLAVKYSTSYNGQALGTMAIPATGKWYFEVDIGTVGGGGDATGIGVMAPNEPLNTHVRIDTGYRPGGLGVHYQMSNGNKRIDGTDSSYGGSPAVDSVIGVAINADEGAIWFSDDGTWQNSATIAEINAGTDTNAADTDRDYGAIKYVPSVYHTVVGTDTLTFNFGQHAFQNTQPTDYLPLNTTNIPRPAIIDPSKHHQVELVPHNGTSTDFTLAWDANTHDTLFIIKNKDAAEAWFWVDGVRGYNKYYATPGTAAWTTDANVISVGAGNAGTTITLGSTLLNNNYIVECHKAGPNASRDTANSGTISDTGFIRSTNSATEFSIIAYTGSGTTGHTIEHGLGAKPDLIFFSQDNTSQNKRCYHSAIGATAFLNVEIDDAAATNIGFMNNVEPGGAGGVITLGASSFSINDDGADQVCYAWAKVRGYSAFGKYTGKTSYDSAAVITGFRPAMVINKNIDAVENWFSHDYLRAGFNGPTDSGETSTVLGGNRYLRFNVTAAESNHNFIDILSNGFKVRYNDGAMGAGNADVVYMAWAKNPFGGAGVSPATAR